MADEDVQNGQNGLEKESDADPGTSPFVPDFDDDTGSQPIPGLAAPASADADDEPDKPPADESAAAEPPSGADEDKSDVAVAEVAAAPVSVPGRYLYVKWWKLLLVIFAAWVPAALIGLGLFYWWFNTLDKTAPVFVVLVYIVACWVGATLLSMVPGRPLLTALSLGVLTGPFASVAAAAPLYGSYYCEHVARCLIGVLPY